MTPAQDRMVARLRPLLDDRAIVTDPNEIAPWEIDWRRRYHGCAPVMFAPKTTEAVAFIVKAAAAERVPIVPQGGNSSMVGGATPPENGSAVILSLRRMNNIRNIDPHAGRITVEAGVILADLQQAAIDAGRRFPLTLGARGNATVGGLVSTNAGGTQVLRFGTMRALVGGIEAVMADGNVYDGLAALKKDNRGYAIDQLLIGAEGTLGIITAATLRLVPAIAQRATAWVGLADPHQALALLRSLEARTDAVESFELLPVETLEAALAYLPGAHAPLQGRHRWHVLIEATAAEGDTEAPSSLLERLLGEALALERIADAVIAANESQTEAFWRLRDALSDAERSLGPATQHDIAVPVDAMPDFLAEATRACERQFQGTTASGFGHLGDGNIHFHVRAPSGADHETFYRKDAPRIERFVHDLVTAFGGTISAEHGIGQMKREELERLSSPARMKTLRAIKTALDPLGIFNPGKLVALAPSGAVS